METQTLTRASRELYRRRPDECFDTLSDLAAHCRQRRRAFDRPLEAAQPIGSYRFRRRTLGLEARFGRRLPDE